MMYDTFMFSNELELLELRLQELNDIVDKFVLVESTKTFRGQSKPLYYQENKEKFKAYDNKIINLAVDITVPDRNQNNVITPPKYREYCQRNAISIGLQNCSDDDIIMVSDIDEIPNKNVIKKLINNQEIKNDSIICLNMRLFYYYINCWMEDLELWGGTTIARYGLFKTKGPQWMRDNGYKYTMIKNENAGWHFTYLNFNPQRIIDKIVTMTSDPDVDVEKYSKKEWVESCIKDHKDLYGRDHRLKTIDLDDTFPETILKNPEKYPICPVMKNSNMKNDNKMLFISMDLNTDTSGGIVASKELEAMQQLEKENNNKQLPAKANDTTTYAIVLKPTTPHSDHCEQVIIFDHKDINPLSFGLPDTPFLQDYLTLEHLSKIDLSKIILCHMYSTPFPQTIRYLKSKNIKTSITCAAHIREDTIREFELLGYTYPYNHIKDDNLWKIYNADIREADIVITPSNASKEFLLKEGAKRVVVIPHGTTIPDKNDIKRFPKQFVCGYAGAIGPDKGLKYLIQSWSRLNYQDSTLLFVGNQSQQLTPFINQYATGGKYHLAGYINNIADFYNSISIYIQPSIAEGFGLEILEAMSYGRPVICSDGAGAADCVSDEIDGFVIPKRSPDILAEKIQYFKNQPDKIIEFGKKAREKSLQYSWSIVKDMYIDIWKSLLDK